MALQQCLSFENIKKRKVEPDCNFIHRLLTTFIQHNPVFCEKNEIKTAFLSYFDDREIVDIHTYKQNLQQ